MFSSMAMFVCLWSGCLDAPDVGDSAGVPPGVTEAPLGEYVPQEDNDEQFRFVVIGDYGTDNYYSEAVAGLVESMGPDFIITVGDNNYPSGTAATIDANVGQYYSDYIYPYMGTYGPGADENRFWPCPGNHDWGYVDGLQPYMDYFTLPGNERYYRYVYEEGFEFFCVDSDSDEDDGISKDSIQAQWFYETAASSDPVFRVVYMHHPPYSSGNHGDNVELQWPFDEWDVNIVFGGHDHIYERQVRDGIPYVITGTGGAGLYGYQEGTPESMVAFNGEHGAVLVRVSNQLITVEAVTVSGGLVDQFHLLPGSPLGNRRSLVAPQALWRMNTAPTDEDWLNSEYDDSHWESVEGLPAKLPQDLSNCSDRVRLRQVFTVEDPDSVQNSEIWVNAQDGYRVYLNGIQIDEHNVLTGDLGKNRQIMSNLNVDDHRVVKVPTGGLRSGDNVLAVELRQYSVPGSSGCRFGAGLDADVGDALVATGSQWRIVEGESDNVAWTQLDFIDGGWAEMTAPVSILESQDTGMGRVSAIRARHVFTVDDPQDYESLLLKLKRADGAVVYLNGTEVLRSNMTSTGEGLMMVEGLRRDRPLVSALDTSLLLPGDNVVAVEIHSALYNIEGLAFNLEVTGVD